MEVMSNDLFLGNCIDRGKQSLETVCLLLAYKIKYPENFFILHGNHECASINHIYAFYNECKRKFGIKLWKTVTDCFNCLPCAALIDEKIFCMHSGLSPELTSLDQVKCIVCPMTYWILACCMIFCGQTPTRTLMDGVKTIMVFPSCSVRTLSHSSCTSMTLISFAVPTKLSRMAMNSTRKGSWLCYSQLPTIAANSTMLGYDPLKPFEMDRDLTVLKSCTRWIPLLLIVVAI